MQGCPGAQRRGASVSQGKSADTRVLISERLGAESRGLSGGPF